MSTSKQPKKLINLIRGWPAPAVLPAKQLKVASEIVLSDPSIFVPSLQYGPDPGYQPLREELAKYLGEFFKVTPDLDRICITGGASQNVANILQSFTDPVYTKAVWGVAPIYHLICPIFDDSGFKNRLRAVPEDEEGIRLDWLERGLKSFETSDPGKPIYKDPGPHRKVYRHVIYVVPTCSNPSGITMTVARREGLVRLARKYDALVICDDVYDFLQWPVTASSPTQPNSTPSSYPLPPPDPIPRLVDIDLALGRSPHDPPSLLFGHAISNGTFSKLIGPGVRTGWVEASPAFAFGLAQTGSTKSGGAPSQLAATMVCEMLRNGDLDTHIHSCVRPSLQRRHGLMLRAIKEHLGPFVDFQERNYSMQGQGVYGGYFVWLTLKAGAMKGKVTAKEVAERAMSDENLAVAPGTMFAVKGDEEAVKFDENIRLCFAWEDENNIVEGVERLGRVLKEWDELRSKAAGPKGGGYEDFR